MTNYNKKEENVLSKLDNSLAELDSLENDSKKHSIKTWYYEKKALHEIKKIANDIDKYDKYDEKEWEKTEKEFDKLLNN